ncbi:terminase small subunit [Sphingobacterium alkalisoli]|uniref:Terminase small subunit n=1 Tax=Sphingobacterium alkalisoli TaxID=1874115 RepID=A0A4U0GXF8_9SPHI|nr:terminase small subunit [Sphingobacterium alkalisoli]TJY63813.1 terminase small subunit [Sphingobacterium alkalisoli]GGH24718.1 hypothetical protein GCM10011418_32820 [Sphingobacterium alkalisoli]
MAALTAKQRRFVEEYCIDFNATQAAIRAGYSEKTARSIGCENLTKPDIIEAINQRLESLDLTAAQTSKLMADIAQSSMNDYFRVVERDRIKTVTKPLQVLIDRKKLDIQRAYMYIDRKGFSDKEYDDYVDKHISPLEDDIIRAEIDLEIDPESTFEDSEAEIYETVELDLVKLTKDKERGKIKSFQWGEFGPKVELYAADKMLISIANKLGFFTNKLQLLDKNGDPADPLANDPLAPINLTVNVIEVKKEEINDDVQQATTEGTVQ